MTFSYFITATNEHDPHARVSAAHCQFIQEAIRATPDLMKAELYTPAQITTYHDDGPSPLLALRLEFTSLEALESQVTEGGHLWRLAQSDDWLAPCASLVTHQAMLTRTFMPLTTTPAEPALCSYLVHYPGAAENFNDWLSYYVAHHPQIMLDYPHVRQVNVFTRVDWCESMPWTRVNYMQRNMLTFPSSQLLAEALTSPVRARMREDNGRFPAFSGRACHYPMLTNVIAPDNKKS
ncbi:MULTISPECIES: ethyl tert-butyl ether degradation protein EthD [Paraburkholderia]|uniref:ethyl tert-butyl ether degradation protein EthD n=1 Tax=Paraburkholderia TaxID=1822464 RepID=UPI001B0AD95E|nr:MULTISPECIES: ethyl tert-butyl ether degradation protein EthD [Paraburkholderia]MCX4153826.1 ethyl tert-butyl ether degradation protein EthD [Paraburkholderia aspalathi]MDN7163241.1 ethyl tert-butyl ether degradation protein EthD [Paraburkholderia sp. SECH2]MDQ6391726.1 ethyl tert-butyl ether degradation protein EthD [Paraburkholderia aspalathi]CAE6789853.1 hypothetical protein R20943_04704 [Paraburkholderia aspalathi]